MSVKKKIHRIDDDSRLLDTIERGNIGDIIHIIPGNQLGEAVYIIVEKEATDDEGNPLKDDKGNPIIIKDVDLLHDTSREMESFYTETSGGRRRKRKTNRNKMRVRKSRKNKRNSKGKNKKQ